MMLDSYKVSMGITHPYLTVDEIKNMLGFSYPLKRYTRDIGEKMLGKNGNRIGRVATETTVGYITHEDVIDNNKYRLDHFISDLLQECDIEVMNSLSNSGGMVQLTIGIFTNENFEFFLNKELLSELSNMNIEIFFDIYGEGVNRD